MIKMEMKEKNAWISFKLVVTGFIGIKKDPNYETLVAEVLQNVGLQHQYQSPFPSLTFGLLFRKS